MRRRCRAQRATRYIEPIYRTSHSRAVVRDVGGASEGGREWAARFRGRPLQCCAALPAPLERAAASSVVSANGEAAETTAKTTKRWENGFQSGSFVRSRAAGHGYVAFARRRDRRRTRHCGRASRPSSTLRRASTLTAVPSVTDYALARRAVLRDYRSGALTRLDVCDAHPELMRAAQNIGVQINDQCPVCGESNLRLVKYVYGDKLKQANGRAIANVAELVKLGASCDEFACYDVEVCLDCKWNHLRRQSLHGRLHAS